MARRVYVRRPVWRLLADRVRGYYYYTSAGVGKLFYRVTFRSGDYISLHAISMSFSLLCGYHCTFFFCGVDFDLFGVLAGVAWRALASSVETNCGCLWSLFRVGWRAHRVRCTRWARCQARMNCRCWPRSSLYISHNV